MKPNAFRNATTLAFSVAFAGAVMAQSPSPQTTPQTPQTKPQTQQTQPRQGSLQSMIGQTVTVSGCLAQEGAVAGQTPRTGTPSTPGTPGTPGATARTGAASEYILTNVQVRSGAPTAGADRPGTPSDPSRPGTPGAPGTPSTPGTPGEPGTPSTPGSPSTPSTTGGAMASGAGSMNVKLKQVDDDQMRSNLNKRVEVTGRLQAASSSTGTQPSTTPGAPETAARGGQNQQMPELNVTNVRVLDQPCTPKQ